MDFLLLNGSRISRRWRRGKSQDTQLDNASNLFRWSCGQSYFTGSLLAEYTGNGDVSGAE